LLHALVVLLVVLVVALLWAASPVVTLVFGAWVVFATLGYIVGVPKGHGVGGVLLGGFLGPLGLLIVAMFKPRSASLNNDPRHFV
jgi:hypothetical protein